MSDSELLNIFWIEVADYLQALNNHLLEVEMAEGDQRKEMLREMNRVAHSMKGAARAVGLNLIERIAHDMEEIFNGALEGKFELTPDAADTLYDSVDIIQNIMNGVENNEEVVRDVQATLKAHIAIIEGVESAADDAGEGGGAHDDAPLPEHAHVTPTDTSSHEMPAINLDSINGATFKEEPAASGAVPAQPRNTQKPAAPPEGDKRHTVEFGDAAPTIMMRPLEETIRVAVSKLDKLMAESSELLVSRMQGEERQRHMLKMRRTHSRWVREWRNVRAAYIRLVRRMQDEDDPISNELGTIFKFLESNQRNLSEMGRELAHLNQAAAQDNMHLSALADQLQDDIGAMRMMPFETIVGSFQRMVRDLARDMGKQVNLDIIGAGVEVDKNVLDSLNDPLLHLLRNAIDHGLETPAERGELGKPPIGQIKIQVQQRGSEIIMQMIDDGRGIDVFKVRRKIVTSGLLTEAEVGSLGDDEAIQFIFHPGFSTSSVVTAVSGRGLGMDIVRTRVESLRGQVSVQSKRGEGTTITLRMPVSLTRIRCILLTVGDEQYAIPSVMVQRMITIQRDSVFTAEGKDMVTVNGQPMPLVSLSALLDISSSGASQDEPINLLSIQAGERSVAFEVDFLSSEVELVLKPLGRELKNTPYIAGAALLGTGDVIIVLDANDLVRRATGSMIPRRKTGSSVLVRQSAAVRRVRVLVVDDSITTRTLEKNILETAGFDVYVAIDGVEAWSILAEMDFDIVISDVEMPNMNGLELTQRIKNTPTTMELPVILLTSLSKPEQREAGLRAGANAYLVKSQFDQGQLLEAIQALL